MFPDQIVITSAVRTAVGSFLGSLQSHEAFELGAIAIQEALRRSHVEPGEVSEVIVGQILTAGKGMNPGRQAAVKAGIPYSTPAYTINMLCGSGLKAVMLGVQAIKTGDSKIVVCGGQESMSRAEHTVQFRSPTKFGDVVLRDSLMVDGLQCSLIDAPMGITAENVARSCRISREDQDAFAVESQEKAAAAIKSGVFAEQIVPVETYPKRGTGVPELVVDDEFPRPSTTTASLAKLKPAFLLDGTGTVTAGNSTGLNDGAAFCVLMSEKEARERHLVPLARIVAYSQVGIEPDIMGFGPVPAVKAVLGKAGWTKEEVDLFEFNEAFAAQSLAVIRALELDPRKVNVYGGAIALGHPLGASGARILTTLIYALKEKNLRRGVAALCVGGGMGVAMCIERPAEWSSVNGR